MDATKPTSAATPTEFKSARIRLGMTQVEIGRFLADTKERRKVGDTSSRQIRYYETGKRNVQTSAWVKIQAELARRGV